MLFGISGNDDNDQMTLFRANSNHHQLLSGIHDSTLTHNNKNFSLHDMICHLMSSLEHNCKQ